MEDDQPSTNPSAAAVAAAASAPVVFKQRKNRGAVRKRPAAEEAGSEEEEDETAVVRKSKQAKGEPLAFSTKREGREEVSLTYESNKALQTGANDATRVLETETETHLDARAQREQVLRQGVEGPESAPNAGGKYKGMNGYVDYTAGFRREHNVGSEKGSGTHGPLRATAFIRTSARFDYQPDVCKDYKETGFCSFGDSCKFMHDRGDYKSGWEMEREWEEEQKRKQEAMQKGWTVDGEEEEEAPADADDDLPFACYICRTPWADAKSDPVVTRCRHYFCESCALKHNSKTGKCAACEQPTSGIFNVATDILKKLKRQQVKDADG